MAVPTSITQLSTTEASNSPSGSEAIGTNLDNYLRAIQSILKTTVSQGTDITSASTITPGDGNYFVVTGSTTITAIGSTNSWNGREIVLKFSSTPQLTHSTSLILPGAANITAAAGDVASFVQESSGVWRCATFQASGLVVSSASLYATSSLPLTFYTGGSERMRIDTSGNVGVGVTPSARLDVSTSATQVARIASSGSVGYLTFENSGSGINNISVGASGSSFRIRTGGADTISVDSSGVITSISATGGLGYGTGAGGTVTQSTSKSTAVTLNKPTGYISTHNAALAANTTVSFTFTNSLIALRDLVLINVASDSGGSPANYNVWAVPAAGSCTVHIRNISAVSQSDSLILNFAIIKGSTS